MPEERRPYVKPLIHQMHYTVDADVSLARICKNANSATGSTIAGCLQANSIGHCATVGS